MNSTSKVTIVDNGMQVDFLPLLITLFMFGLPLLWGLGVFLKYGLLFIYL